MEKREQIINKLRKLRSQHEASVGEGHGNAPGFIDDEMVTRKSYRLEVEGALESGALTPDDLKAAGVSEWLEQNEES